MFLLVQSDAARRCGADPPAAPDQRDDSGCRGHADGGAPRLSEAKVITPMTKVITRTTMITLIIFGPGMSIFGHPAQSPEITAKSRPCRATASL